MIHKYRFLTSSIVSGILLCIAGSAGADNYEKSYFYGTWSLQCGAWQDKPGAIRIKSHTTYKANGTAIGTMVVDNGNDIRKNTYKKRIQHLQIDGNKFEIRTFMSAAQSPDDTASTLYQRGRILDQNTYKVKYSELKYNGQPPTDGKESNIYHRCENR